MIRRLLVSTLAATSAFAAGTSVGQSQNSQQAIEEIEVFANNRRAEGLSNVNAAVSIIGEEELDLIIYELKILLINDLFLDLLLDVLLDIFIDVYLDLFVDVFLDLFVDVLLDLFVDVLLDLFVDLLFKLDGFLP